MAYSIPNTGVTRDPYGTNATGVTKQPSYMQSMMSSMNAPSSSSMASQPSSVGSNGMIMGGWRGNGASNTGSVGSPSSKNANGGTNPNFSYDYSQPQAPNQSGLPGNVAPVAVASQRTGFAMPTDSNTSSLQQIVSQYMTPSINFSTPQGISQMTGPNIAAPTEASQGLQVNPYVTEMLQKKANQGISDFGIPAQIQQQMKDNMNTQVLQGLQGQQDAARRQYAKMGLLSDSAMAENEGNLSNQALQNIYQNKSNVETQSALQASQQYQQNMNDVLGAGQNLTQMGEQNRQANLQGMIQNAQQNEAGRQFNISAATDSNRLNDAIGQWLESGQENRANINNSIANFLENLQLNRQQLSSGVISDAAKTAAYNQNTLSGLLQQTPMQAFQTG